MENLKKNFVTEYIPKFKKWFDQLFICLPAISMCLLLEYAMLLLLAVTIREEDRTNIFQR